MTKTKLSTLINKKKWYYKNSDITDANFPAPEKIETENWKLIRMDKSFSSKEAIKRIKAEGCRPANIHELALFANNHPEEFFDGKWTGVLAFGTNFKDSGGGHRVPGVLRYSDGDFEFDLGYFESDWDSGPCLLCFCDSTQALSTSENVDLETTLTLSRAVQICKDAGYVVYEPK